MNALNAHPSAGMEAPALHRQSALRWMVGALLAVPVAYPDVPLYWAGFAAFALVMLTTPLDHFNRNPPVVLGVVAMCVVAVISNLLSPYAYVRDPARFAVTCSFYVFFLFGLVACDKPQPVLAGLAGGILTQALLVLVAAVVKFGWSQGLLNWTVPELRLWGADWFPDWPNFYAILLSVGFLLFLLHYRKPIPAAICFAAAVLTTSRSVMLALAIGLAWRVLAAEGPNRMRVFAWTAAIVTAIGVLFALAVAGTGNLDAFIERMSLLSDREEIWQSQLGLFLDQPWFGVGGVMLDESVGHTGYASFHNSLGEILVRHGLIGFIVYCGLLLTFLRRARITHPAFAVLLFLLATSVFQNTLRHPHFFMMYSLFAMLAVPQET